MKKLAAVIVALLFVFAISACAKNKEGEKVRLKCPACGYEFEMPAEGGG